LLTFPDALDSAVWALRTAGVLEVACGADVAVDRLLLAVDRFDCAEERFDRSVLS
jgi:hypothetical protein